MISVFSSAPSLSRPLLPPAPPKSPPTTTTASSSSTTIKACRSPRELPHQACQGGDGLSSRRALLGGALAAALIAMGPGEEARAMGWPEGPLAEEFWDNVRRYGLYILTVSTGAIYTIFQPIVELLKSPLTAILIVALLAGGFYLVSQVLSAMVGINDFSYNYGY